MNEVVKGQIGPDVEPASEATVRDYVTHKLSAARLPDMDRYEHPMSPWRVQQTLIWSRRNQFSLFPNESYDTEFKIIFDQDKVYKYIKTLCAFANAYGGYIFFGISDDGKPADFNFDAFEDYDWDSFGKKLSSSLSPDIQWEHGVIDIPKSPEFRLDMRFMRALAQRQGVPPESLDWLKQGEEDELAMVGVLYAYKSERPVMATVKKGKELSVGKYYFRSRDRNAATEQETDLPRTPKPPVHQISASTHLEAERKKTLKSGSMMDKLFVNLRFQVWA